MCITLVYVEQNPNAKYKLILLNNRDELLTRPTSIARWENDILAGRDERESARGTWLCMSTTGHISNLLTITVPMHKMKSNSATRGVLPLDYAKSKKKPEEFCESLSRTANEYNAFQILCFQRNEYDQYELAGLTYQPDDEIEITKYPSGIHGFSNSPPREPFKKVQRGIEKMSTIIEEINSKNYSEAQIIEHLLQLATDKHQCFPDDQLKRRCGRSTEICKYRTAIFVKFPDGIPYGTRSHTIIIVDRNNRVTYYEKSMEAGERRASEDTWTERIFHFQLI